MFRSGQAISGRGDGGAGFGFIANIVRHSTTIHFN
jgi:hypothetical protein